MEVKYSKSVMIFTLITLFLQKFAHSATLVVDGVSEWKNPTVQVGDSVIFRHKNNYNLYIFKNRRAFNLCNYTESTLLTPASPSFTWHPSRLGLFYFAFGYNSTKACDAVEKLAIQVSSFLTPETFTSPPLPQPSVVAPSLTTTDGDHGNIASPSAQPSTNSFSSGGDIIFSTPPLTIGSGNGIGDILSSSPTYTWPNRLKEVTSPSPSPMNAIVPWNGPTTGPGKPGPGKGGGATKGGGARSRDGDSLPFHNKDPSKPLPNEEADSATIRHVPGLYLPVLLTLVMNY